jgi:predicted alpha/beta-hydrolase family hydrolase
MTTLVLAHGAGAGQHHPWMRHVAAGFEARGMRVVTFDFPYMAEGRKMPDKAPVLEAAFIKAWEDAARTATGPMFAAGSRWAAAWHPWLRPVRDFHRRRLD